MKVVSWNCGGAFRKKFDMLEQFAADLHIIQECEDPSHYATSDYHRWAQNYLWAGSKHKGLGVFAKAHVRLEKLHFPDGGLQHFLPCRINNLFNLLAVWTKNGNTKDFQYIGQLWKYLQINMSSLFAVPSLVCGDFNSNAIWDIKHAGCSHTDVVQNFNENNLLSMYHLFNEEKHGAEKTPTFFLQKNILKPYHIDYAFVSRRLHDVSSKFEIGAPDVWLEHSDHMPIVFSINCDPTLIAVEG
jgi:exonuclease III